MPIIEMTRDEYKKKYGVPPPEGRSYVLPPDSSLNSQQTSRAPKPKKPFLEKASDIANIASFGVGRKTGETIGTGLGALYTKGKDLIKGTNDYKYYDLSAPSPLQVGADAAAGAFSIAGFKGLKPTGSLLKNVLKEGALDAGAGASTAIANKKTPGQIAGQAALWGVAGGSLPLAIRGGSKLIKPLTKEGRAANTLSKNVDAVDPELIGRAKIDAYKEIASGREAQNAGMFTDQGLSPSERTVNLAKRLSEHTPLIDGTKVSGVKFGKNPLKNLKIIGKSIRDTETALEKALKENATGEDFVMSSHLNKPNLMAKLDSAKLSAPREFSTIRESKSTFNNVMDFAKEQIDNAEDTITGGRNARTAFDAAARKEYPSVFKNGYIDTSTPAGNAIKKARDLINQHIYESAPNGSDLQKLIGRESDLFNARDISAIKAARLHGKDWWARFAKNNPKLASALKWGGISFGGAVLLKEAKDVFAGEE